MNILDTPACQKLEMNLSPEAGDILMCPVTRVVINQTFIFR